jgi:hypothetical protein
MNKKIIQWEKWRDPFGMEDSETDYPGIEEEATYIDEDSESIESGFKIGSFPSSAINGPVKIISTPMGLIPIDSNMTNKLFNFWTGHTNFDITKKIKETIESTEGVETLEIYTRYRFRVGVGKAFNDSDVMRSINKSVYNEIT